MVTLGELFDELDYELEDMLDALSQAIDLIEDGKVKEGVEVLKALEEDMFDFLDYVDVEEEECDEIEVEEEEAPKKKTAPPKPATKPTTKPSSKKGKK
ncbi:MAG: hypothetical protein HPY73_08340 [Methanomassiliicoccales archaeon]|nr:MAG: hypothetical protein HPY73_08340 [Methanomassiliicoccales archaeon]